MPHYHNLVLQAVYLFTWVFLGWNVGSCDRVPLLGFYQTGVAVTSVAGFFTAFFSDTHDEDCAVEDVQDGVQIAVIARQRKKTSYENINWLDYSNNESKEAIEAEDKKVKVFPTISSLILILHMFWIITGSFCFLPVFAEEGLSQESHGLPNCEAPVRFWVPFLSLCLQFGLGGIFMVWWLVEIRWGARHSDRKHSHPHPLEIN